jgi:Flp pilus assembly protein TadD
MVCAATICGSAVVASAAPAPTAAPKLTSLRLTRTVNAPQGHARFLVGARLSAPATLTVSVRKPGQKKDLRVLSASGLHPAGRAYLQVDAVDARGFQLPAASYVVRVQAKTANGKTSNVLSGRTNIVLGPALGRLDALTVPLIPPFARQAKSEPGGQLVAVVAPQGAAATAGIQRGDVIVSMNGKPVSSPGAMRTVSASLPAGSPLPVELRRQGQVVNAQVTLGPDWTAPPDYGPALRIATQREPDVLAYQYAAVRFEISAGRPDGAAQLLAAWPKTRKDGAIGQLLAGDVALARADGRAALVAYQAASQAEPQVAAGPLGQGLSLVLQGEYAGAAESLSLATTIDPADATALATRALALLRIDRTADALTVANQALTVDPSSSEARVAQGVALIASGSVLDGLSALRQGLLGTSDPARAASIIAKNLEPNDP